MPQLLTVERTDFMIELPVDMILSANGVQVFSAGKRPVKRLAKDNGSTGEGLNSSAFNAQTVQKLVMNGYVEEINTRLAEMLRSRAQIIDTTKLVTFGLLYKKMNPSLAEMMLQSPVMLAYNRKNAQNPIHSIDHINKDKANQLKQTKAEAFEVMALEIRDLTVQRIIANQELQEEDRLMQIRSLEKFISFIDDRIWYLYYIIYQTPLKDEVMSFFAELIDKYLDRTRIATNLSLVLMELIQNAEKAHFDQLLIENKLIKDPKDSHRFLRQPQNRKLVVELAKSRNQTLRASWQFHSGRAGANLEYRLEILITNRGDISPMIEKQLAMKMSSDTANADLSDFFQDKTDSGLGAGLGLMYMSYLKDDCQKAGVKFSSQIFGNSSGGTTTAKLQVLF